MRHDKDASAKEWAAMCVPVCFSWVGNYLIGEKMSCVIKKVRSWRPSWMSRITFLYVTKTCWQSVGGDHGKEWASKKKGEWLAWGWISGTMVFSWRWLAFLRQEGICMSLSPDPFTKVYSKCSNGKMLKKNQGMKQTNILNPRATNVGSCALGIGILQARVCSYLSFPGT